MSYKVVHLVEDQIKTVYVFSGVNDESIKLQFPNVKNIVMMEQISLKLSSLSFPIPP